MGAATRPSITPKTSDIDGGWAWVVLIVSFMSLFLTCGALYSVSIFNVIFLEQFQESKAMTSLVGSILIGLIALMGPVSSILSNRFGWRVPMMLGGLIATIGTFLASMAQNLMQIMFSYGVIAGIGLGLAYTPAIVVVGYYFEKYRTVASGIASVGAGVGMMAFPPLIRFLSEYYSWREMLAYVSCLYAHLCVFGALMRPLPGEAYSNVIPVEQKQQESDTTTAQKGNICDKNSNYAAKKCDDSALNIDLTNTKACDEFEDRDLNDYESVQLPMLLRANKQPEDPRGQLLRASKQPEDPSDKLSVVSLGMKSVYSGILQSSSYTRLDDLPSTNIQRAISKPLLLCSNGLNGAHSLVHLEQISSNNNNNSSARTGSSTLHRSKSVCSLPYGVKEPMTKMPEKCYCTKVGLYFGTCCKYSCSCSRNKTNILSSPIFTSILTGEFVIFCASIFMFGIGLSALYLHLSAFAIASGASETEASFLITLLGISSIISRVFTGIAGNDNSIDNTILYIGAFGIAGISTMLCPSFGGSSKGRMFYALSFGFYGSCFNVLLAPLTVELVGLKNLSTAFGIEMVVNGVAYFIGPPVAGLLYDITGTYNTSFFLAGVCLISSAVVMMLVSVFKRKELPTSIKDSNIMAATARSAAS